MTATAIPKRVLDRIRVEPIPPEYERWLLCDTFTYYLGSADGKEFVRVEQGFETDFASIPWGLRNLFPKVGGSYLPAVLTHDCLYKSGYVLNIDTGEKRAITRAEADAVMLEVMEVCGTPWITRQALYAGVRVGGWLPWQNYRQGLPETR